MTSLARSALWYARHGWRVFPCLERKKLPALKAWQNCATTDLRQVETWWRLRPESNIGLATGPDSNLYVVDVDRHGDDGEATLSKTVRRLGELPVTVEQRTGSGGRQLFFRYPGTHNCHNTTGARRGLGPGLDTRGKGGFVVVPPSMHPCGEPYRWHAERGPHQTMPADLPAPWVERLERRETVTIAVPMPKLRVWPEIGRQVVEQRAQRVARAGKGQRNDELYRAAFYLAKLAGSGLCAWPDAREALVWAAHACGLDRLEAQRTIDSALRGAGTGS